MRIVFRVEGEPQIGLGHIMRCLALAQSFDSEGHQVLFIMSESSQSFCQKRRDWVGDIMPLATFDEQALSNQVSDDYHDIKLLEANWVKHQCSELGADWLVLDGYQFAPSYRQVLCHDNYKLAVFDDMNNSGDLHADLVINGAHNASKLNYQVSAPQAQLALGKSYQVLRKEFLQVSDKNWRKRNTLTLMFGGSDPQNMTLLALQSLQKINAAMSITVVTGVAYTQLHTLQHFIANSQLNVTHHHDCQNMAEILVGTRLALSAAGGSQFECLACATPAMLLVVADNQKFASQQAAKQGWCLVKQWDQVSIDELISTCMSLWQQAELLQSMHVKALQQPIEDGAKAISELMLTLSDKSEFAV
ncbi:UDP-2,4-diacetamido-2,4,6-trideoxy-beta-L-altropyranose hydrolase [Paraglaciecola aquimarina]|uniref:UDP-2,4-diacetamido-2,4, 6-trideoxy-beta-L-altropyranose hydrolase n=1 Tax=Paraglaciecola aquimarina TaxID=1235557 RepID=A0ABU3T0C8_9ALTE|nr:UDP-2,4-diacetamido-2,4,6-trideoxy-beta-L-altropyranose hydrolase [Paraglaciecola aquimarina]MDU0355719.1 UDP-2,4-diacetamido-2,4,6-trideoxy-beta-L-altropyranose hydrolase [Paraglaciecola aquimarina]